MTAPFLLKLAYYVIVLTLLGKDLWLAGKINYYLVNLIFSTT